MPESVVVKGDPTPDPALNQQDNPNNQQQQNNAPDPNRPAWLPEKFKTPEDLAKSYQELEREYTKVKQGQQTPPANQQTPAGQLKIDESGKVMVGNLDVSKYNNEFAQTGQLSEASYKELEGMGLPKAIVDAYIEGQKSLANSFVADVQSSVGGAEAYTQILTWAKTNLSQEEITAFNNVCENGNIPQVKLAVAGIKAKYEAANGKDPNLTRGDKGGSPAVGGFRSYAEVTQAMSDPRYQTDPAYRQDVMDKLRTSKLF